MKKYLLFLILFSSLLASCDEDESNLLDITNYSIGRIIRERPSDNPWIPYDYIERNKLTRSSNPQVISMSFFLGYSFKSDITPIEDTRNLGYKVIDISKLSHAHPSYFRYWLNLSHDAKSYSFTDFEQYHLKSEFSKNVNRGSDFNFLGFNFNHKHVYTSLFGKDETDSKNVVFGELNIILRDSCYRMQYSPTIQKEILSSCLDQDFVTELHSLHPYDFYKKYGAFVASNYSSGGRAIALYDGLLKEGEATETNESDLNKEINASFKWETNESAGGNLKLGHGNSSTSTVTNKFASIYMSVKTLGGSASSSFTIPQDINTASINLSSWLSSLSNNSLDVIAEFNQDGLIPISDFIFDNNLKEKIESYINSKRSQTVKHSEPYISIINGKLSPTNWIIITAVVNRFGEAVGLNVGYLTDADANINDQLYQNWVNDITKIFNIKVVEIPQSKNITFQSQRYPLYNEKTMVTHISHYKKLYHQGILYMFDEGEDDYKYGFSILNDPQLINEYGLLNFISNLQPSTKTYSDLINEGYIITSL